MHTEHTDLLSVSNLPSDKIGYIVICRKSAHCISVVSVSDLVSDSIAIFYLILILTQTLKLNRYVQCAQAVTPLGQGYRAFTLTEVNDPIKCLPRKMGTEPNCIETHFSRTVSRIGRTSWSVCTHS